MNFKTSPIIAASLGLLVRTACSDNSTDVSGNIIDPNTIANDIPKDSARFIGDDSVFNSVPSQISALKNGEYRTYENAVFAECHANDKVLKNHLTITTGGENVTIKKSIYGENIKYDENIFHCLDEDGTMIGDQPDRLSK